MCRPEVGNPSGAVAVQSKETGGRESGGHPICSQNCCAKGQGTLGDDVVGVLRITSADVATVVLKHAFASEVDFALDAVLDQQPGEESDFGGSSVMPNEVDVGTGGDPVDLGSREAVALQLEEAGAGVDPRQCEIVDDFLDGSKVLGCCRSESGNQEMQEPVSCNLAYRDAVAGDVAMQGRVHRGEGYAAEPDILP